MILRIIAAYLCLGVAVETIEEMIVVKNSKKWFGVETEVKPFGIGMGYNLTFYLTILHDIIVWPFGIVSLIRGVRRIRRKGNTEITKRAEELEKWFHK